MTEHETPERTVAYVVYADYGYGSAAIKAFVSKPDAVGFRDACQIHHDNEPRYEGNDDNNTALEQWENEHNLWVQQHPAGEQIGAEGFFVSKIELVPKQAVAKASEARSVGADPTVNDAQTRELEDVRRAMRASVRHQLAQAEQEIARLREGLKAMEWDLGNCCPVCGNSIAFGHGINCLLAALLAPQEPTP